MTPDEIRTIIRETYKELHEEQGIDHHQIDHAWIRSQIQKEERKQEQWNKIKVHVLGWGLVGGIGWLGSLIFDYFDRLWNH